MTLLCHIGATAGDLTNTGTDVTPYLDLPSVEIEPTDGTVYGTLTLRLSTTGSILDIQGHQEIYLIDYTGTTVNTVYFAGFIVDIRPDVNGATKTYTLAARDFSELLDTIQYETTTGSGVLTLVTNTFKVQIQTAMAAIMASGAGPPFATINTSTYVQDLSSGSFLNGFGIAQPNPTIRQMIQAAMDAFLPAAFPALQPVMYITMLPKLGGGGGQAYLHIEDWAPGTLSTLGTYSDAPSGGTHGFLNKFQRRLDSTALGNRQIVWGGGGLVAAYQDDTSIARQPNNWSPSASWCLPTITDSTLGTSSRVSGRAQKEVLAHSNDRETASFDTADALTLPGKAVITNSFHGLSGVSYTIAALRLRFANPVRPLTEVTLGERLLELGDPTVGLLGATVERDLVPPAAPTWPAGSTWVLENRYSPATGVARIHVQCNASDPDTAWYIFQAHAPGKGYSTFATVAAPATDAILLNASPGLLYSFQVYARDGHGNTSPSPSATVTVTAASGPGGGAPGVPESTQPAYDGPALWPYTQTSGTAVAAVDLAVTYQTAPAYVLAAAGADTIELTRDPFGTDAGQAWKIAVAYMRDSGSPTWQGFVDWDDGSNTWALTASTLTLPAPTTSLHYEEQQVLAPSTAAQGRIRWVLIAAAAVTIWLVPFAPTPAKTDTDLNLATLNFRHPTTNAILSTFSVNTSTGSVSVTNPTSGTDSPLIGTSTNGAGVTGESTNSDGVFGTSTNGFGLHGQGLSGVLGEASGNSSHVGVLGDGGGSADGVVGVASGGRGIVGASDSNASGYFQSNDAANTAPTVIIQQTGSSTANLLEFRDSSGTLLSHVDYLGVWHTP